MHCNAMRWNRWLPYSKTCVSSNGSKPASLVLELFLLSSSLHAVVEPGRKGEFFPCVYIEGSLRRMVLTCTRQWWPIQPRAKCLGSKLQSFLQTAKRFRLDFNWLYRWHYLSVPGEAKGKFERDPKVKDSHCQISWYLFLSHWQTEHLIAVVRREQDGQTKLQAGIWANDPRVWGVLPSSPKTCSTSFCQGFLQVEQSVHPQTWTRILGRNTVSSCNQITAKVGQK